MKKSITLIVTIIVSVAASAQIKTLSIEKKPEEKKVHPYDSLTNIAEFNYASQVGQTLYVMPTKRNEEWKKSFDKNTQGSSYDKMKGKYFEFVGIRKGTKYGDVDLRLVSKETGKTIYCDAGMYSSLEFFLTVGYFEKLKSRIVGKKFYYVRKEYSKNWNALKNIEDGKDRTDIPNETLFEAVDVVVNEKSNNSSPIIVILENAEYGRAFVMDQYIMQSFDQKSSFRDFIPYEERQRKEAERVAAEAAAEAERVAAEAAAEAERVAAEAAAEAEKAALIKKYGKTNGTLISEGKVRIGFTKQMCIDAWGNPEDINRTTGSWGVHEQWVYGGRTYLYFENGILTTIQN